MADLYEIEVFRHGSWRRYDACAMREDARAVAHRLRCMGHKVRVMFKGEEVADG